MRVCADTACDEWTGGRGGGRPYLYRAAVSPPRRLSDGFGPIVGRAFWYIALRPGAPRPPLPRPRAPRTPRAQPRPGHSRSASHSATSLLILLCRSRDLLAPHVLLFCNNEPMVGEVIVECGPPTAAVHPRALPSTLMLLKCKLLLCHKVISVLPGLEHSSHSSMFPFQQWMIQGTRVAGAVRSTPAASPAIGKRNV
ncbi:unnamed protein product [Danaus chrysippus]|uniref:(African queen) hypothetical protein n=1 Tax=Danaus chrysippus TaxID=151541 RepID=A0A8J2R4W7_9NEOP|nr:unnamed protein product [Danaus chrysippus]